MTAASRIADAEVGSQLPPHEFRVRRADLVAYAAASGDANPIHLDDEAARAAGLPGVVAHGMLTMALAARALEEWAGGGQAVLELGARFTRPVVVPADGTGVRVEVRGTVTGKPGDGTAGVSLDVTCQGEPVLGVARARVKISAGREVGA